MSHITDSEIRLPALAKAGSRAIEPRAISSAKWLLSKLTSTVPIKTIFNIDLINSTAAFTPTIFFIPLIGLSLEKSGKMDLNENKKPPVAPEANIATTMVSSISGKTNSRPWSNWLPKAAGSSMGDSSNLRSNVKPAPKYTDNCLNHTSPSISSMKTLQIMTAAAGSSLERATWPSSRARLRRRAVGSSVRSPLSSAMA